MHTIVILTNKRRTHAQSNYTNTKLKAWFRRLLHHQARKRSGPILQPRTHTGGYRYKLVAPVISKSLAGVWAQSASRRKHDRSLQVSNDTIDSARGINACLSST